MSKGDFAPGFPLRHAHKDVGLALEAAGGRVAGLPLTEAIGRHWSDAIAQGYGGSGERSARDRGRRPAGRVEFRRHGQSQGHRGRAHWAVASCATCVITSYLFPPTRQVARSAL
jgi:hypothetical protein